MKFPSSNRSLHYDLLVNDILLFFSAESASNEVADQGQCNFSLIHRHKVASVIDVSQPQVAHSFIEPNHFLIDLPRSQKRISE